MTTAVATAAYAPSRRAAYDRRFYSGMALALALTVFAGFARTFYLRAWFDVPTISGATQLTPLAYLHGAVFSAWVLLFLVQTSLVATRRVAVHRQLGFAGAALAVAMIIVGTRTAITAAARGSTGAPGVNPLEFMVVPLADMVLFTIFVTGAILARRDRESHKRLMLLAYVSIITASVARIPGVAGGNPLLFFGLSMIFVLTGIAYDRWSRGRVHRVYLWGGALVALSVPGRLALSGTSAWHRFAEMLVR